MTKPAYAETGKHRRELDTELRQADEDTDQHHTFWTSC